MVFLFVKWSLLGHFRSPAGLGVFGAAEELVGSFSPCSEWFVLRSSSLFLVGALQQMSEPCIDARSYLAVFVLVLIVLCSVLFLIPRRSSGADVRSYRADGGAIEQMFGAIEQMFGAYRAWQAPPLAWQAILPAF